MSDFDTELFIGEVEKRPQLYNKNLKEYSDRNVKEKLWAELCVMFIPNFSTLQDSEKKEKGTAMRILLVAYCYYYVVIGHGPCRGNLYC